MSYEYLNNMELNEALQRYLEVIASLNKNQETEEIAVKDSFGRITSEAVYANISSPHYNASAMDGIALLAKSTFGATDTTPVILTEGIDYQVVDTGDPIPDPYDAVVMVEEVIQLGNGQAQLLSAASPWQNIRQIGEDICASEMIIPSNIRIEPAAIGAMLAGGVMKVKVWKKPVVGLIPTGDEIVSPISNPKSGEIIEFNSSIFSAMLQQWGAVPKVYDIVPDKFDLIKSAVKKAADECDLVILNAGSSAGREDFSTQVIREMGSVIIHGIAIKPGKPAILGVVNERPVIGVPGYPVSGMIVMEKFVKRLLEILLHSGLRDNVQTKAILSKKVVSSLKYQEFVRMKLGNVDGKLIATALNRGAGVVTSLVKADAILEIPLNCEGYEAGQEVVVELLKQERDINRTLVIIGSHDPLIDVASDLMNKHSRGRYISSAHVGSMGGIMAIKRGEAHLAAIHLLDEETGGYNLSYIKKYLGEEKISLISCVKRVQGLMIAQGNPKMINGLEDLTREGIRYVNRQKGSGTRILLDYLLKLNHLSFKDIYGYDREEYTHMSVAALVASGSADAGMGIYSAARIYGLDFIPVCQEQYDFIMPARTMESENVQAFLNILKSNEFFSRLEQIGGYIVEAPGTIQIIE
ncbi:molybdopterin biosynthesis protein [Dehalobacter sp. DCM]|uniref:molybdopterin biosynthesis protein n=1 Tax=Dehalobacter sp. DCM TaxID=2907827 RepID=UPI0030817CE8|nr:molybdopterin biosynthesis protein [Dehalobacter sp. DCM]